jgi:hypothetical protein
LAWIAWSVSILILSGCVETKVIQGYEGPARSDDKVAIVHPGDAYIDRIVDEARNAPVSGVGPWGQAGWIAGTDHFVKLAPGTYRITYSAVECQPWCRSWVKVQRDAVVTLQAGHTYSTHSRSNCFFLFTCTKPPSIWFSDETSGQVLDDCSTGEMACRVTRGHR